MRKRRLGIRGEGHCLLAIASPSATLHIRRTASADFCAQQRQLRLAQGFGLGQLLFFTQAVEALHQLRRIGIRHRPEGGQADARPRGLVECTHLAAFNQIARSTMGLTSTPPPTLHPAGLW